MVIFIFEKINRRINSTIEEYHYNCEMKIYTVPVSLVSKIVNEIVHRVI